MSNFLLVDSVGQAQWTLNEAVNEKDGLLRFRGKFQEVNSVNKNKRIYPESILKKEVNTIQPLIEACGLMGEIDHPETSIVGLSKVSHAITKLWWEGNVLMGEGKVLPTPAGKVLKAILEAGMRVGISSRGVGSGSTNSDGILEINNYKLITWDMVADPSTHDAFQKVITSESFQEKFTPTPLNTINTGAMIVSYMEHLISKKTQEFKERVK